MSLTIKHRVSLDLSLTSVQATIPFRKGDKGAHEVVFSLRNGTTNVELPPGTVATIAVFNGAKDGTNDGAGVVDMCTVDHINHRIIYIPTVAALSVAGNVACELTVVGTNGEVLGAPRIHFFVDDSETDVTEREIDEALQASGSWDVIQKTAMNAKDAEQSKEDAETAQGKAESAQGAAVAAKTAAETAQGKAESAQGAAVAAKTAAEAAQGKAEAAKTAAETAQGKAETAKTAAETAQGKAETAKTAAETAQGKAETAKTASETAKTDAVAAKTAAESAKNAADAAKVGAQVAQSGAYNSASAASVSAISAGESAKKAQEYAEKIGAGAASITASLNDRDYKLTIALLDASGKVMLPEATIDLPLESLITHIAYDDKTKELIFTLHNGNTTRVPLDDTVSGLATEAELDAGLAGKVDKLTTARKLYGTNSAGKQTSYSIADDIGDDTENPTLTILTQAAVTATMNALSARIETNKKNITKNTEDIASNTERISELEKGGGGSGESAEFVEKEDLYSKKETDEYEDVQIATLPIDAFSLRTGSVKGDTALIEVEPSGTYIISFDKCIEHSGSASLYLSEYTEENEQVVADAKLDFEIIGTSGTSPALIASIFPNGGRCTITVGATTKYIKLMFDAYYGAPERLPSGLTLAYKSPILGYGDIKVEKLPTKVVSNNLFNKATASTGKNVYLGKNSKGEPLYGWFCNVYNVVATEASGSGFDSTSTAIEVEGGQTYFKSANTIIHFFDENDVWINSPRPAFGALSVVAPDNAKYVRIGFISSYLDTLQFVKGDKYLPYDDYKIGIENFDSDKSPQISEVLVRNALQYPFMQEYMWKIAEEAHKYTAPDRHTFLFISDTHANSMSNRPMAIVANMTKYVPCSCVVHGGDIIDGLTPKENELMLLTTLVRNGNEAKCPVYYVKGNHDWNLLYRSMVNTSATRDEYILNSELARRTNCFIKNKVHGDVENMYFYVDDETTKIRTIIFNCVNKDESGDRSALDNNLQIWGEAQVKWLINEALNFKDVSDKDEWGVIVIQHQSSGSGFWKILNGFKNGTSGTATGSEDESLSIPFDFSEQGSMNLIANFVGDIHHDAVVKVGTTPVVMIVNASLANDYADGHTPSLTEALLPANKAFGTENETAFDIVTIDKKNHLIYLTRYGARSYAYNSATGAYDKIAARTRVVDYLTGTCIVITED